MYFVIHSRLRVVIVIFYKSPTFIFILGFANFFNLFKPIIDGLDVLGFFYAKMYFEHSRTIKLNQTTH